MSIVDQAKEATRVMIFGELGTAAEYRPTLGAPAPLNVIFKSLGRADADYGDAYYASIDVMRDEVSGCPAKGDEFFIETESPQSWIVSEEGEGETDGQTRFTWSVRCVGNEGRRLNPGRLERI